MIPRNRQRVFRAGGVSWNTVLICDELGLLLGCGRPSLDLAREPQGLDSLVVVSEQTVQYLIGVLAQRRTGPADLPRCSA